ncbi:MAG: S-adenosylmethionine:tRNA ribosyltransferase-isomerase [Chitinophagaceae bacterium]|nr:S-adenosylmethionine:tRNA ribosyltransferase-isomerase [Chitinophagaceae bacterium]
MHPRDIAIKDYTYFLPEEKIAHYPLTEREASKLLVYKNGSISEDTYRNIDVHLPSNSLLVFNNTKVIEARLLFQKPTGGMIEIFCLEPHEQYEDITSAMVQHGKVLWKCLVGGASKWKHGQVLEKKTSIKTSEITLRAVYKEKRADHFIIDLSWQPASMSFAEILHHHGAIPLPPYLKREAERADQERYQTIYAHYEGSVAAPTAGLHFTDTIFEKLEKKGIRTDFVTLHVGAGTFKPVKSETMHEHEMHAEFMDVSFSTVQNIIRHLPDNIIAVGTTSLRTIESLYWIGVKLLAGESKPVSEITQWEVYDELPQNIPAVDALQTLLQWMKQNGRDRLLARTQIIIAPGYKPRIAKGLITNFHQPGSTLLLLVAALIGDEWKKVYDHALENEFRFLSYGDGSLLWIS